MKNTNTGNKVLKKVKGIWVAVALVGAIGLSSPSIVANAQSPVEIVLTSNASTKFSNKAELADDELVQTESAKALESITGKWEQNTLEQVKAEIERQKELGLEAYVVQWGDTLSVIAEAIESDVQELADANGITDRDLILTGDILNGVLSEAESVVVSQAPTQTDNSNQVTPAQPSKPAPEAPKPVEPKPETPETPVEPKPETPETPVEPKPETPEVPETPETPDDVVVVEDVLETEVIKFESETVENPELAEGVKRVAQEGKDGVLTITFKVTTTNGEVTSKDEVKREVTTKPVNEIIEIGTKKAESDEVVETSVTETKSVDFKTETRENADLPKGETKVVQEGKAGVETITYKVTTVNGKETKREETKREVTTKPVNKIVEVGTKEDKVEVVEVTDTKSIDFKTETRDNADLPKGETKVVQEGKAGVETITYKVTKVNGKETKREEIKREVTTKPVNKIVEVGTKVEYQEPTVTKTEHKNGSTEIRNEVYNEVNNGAHGNLAMAGGDYQTGRGDIVSETENSYVDANGDTIVEVTTNQRGYFTYTPNIYNDNTLEPGVNVTTVQGQEGYMSYGYTDVYKNGVYQTTTYYDNGVVVDATVGTVLRGTKDITGSRTWTEFTPIIAGTITTNDPNKSSSESYTVAGKDGYIAINYKSTNGGSAVEVSREVVDAVYHEVFNGTK